MMKNILSILFLLLFTALTAQNIEADWNTVYKNSKTEKVYVQLNNVLYNPGETVFFKAFITESDNRPTTLSAYLYVEFFQGNKKVFSQNYEIENGSAVCSYKIPSDAVAGLYKIKAYTKIQNQLSENIFEKTFFVQKVVSPRILMTLDFKKKAYGKGETCEADFVLKNLDNEPIRNYDFKYDVFVSGKKIDSLKGKTDDLGKAVVQFKLPANLDSNDGILNVMLDYDNFKESVTRSIPISLDFVDLQFLAESGNMILNELSSLYFIAKNEFGLPMDVAGFIEDENGNKITDFKCIHDGMGNVMLKTEGTKKYFAVVTSPFKSNEKIALPIAEENVFTINAKRKTETVLLNIYAPLEIEGKVLVRNLAQICKTINLNLKKGWNVIEVNTKDFPVGIHSFSLLIKDNVVAERLVFLNYQNGLKIEIKTDKETYLPREKVNVSIVTKDKNNMPIPSSLSVSVVDSKLLTYIDDKQDNILSWLFLGFELKGKIHEPRFYFDDNKTQEIKEEAIDLLLNTHGWRKYNQKNLQNLVSEVKNGILPEQNNGIAGFVTNQRKKGVSKKVLLFSDGGKVYETKSNSSGYFIFNKVSFSNFAYLLVEGKNNGEEYLITNSYTNSSRFLLMKDTLRNKTPLEVSFRPTETKETITESGQIRGTPIVMSSDSAELSDVVVVGYGMSNKKLISGAITKISATDIISSSLSGRVAGVQITESSGQPGSADKVRIRGLSSVYGNRAGGQPLIVVDGIAYVNNENSSVFGNLSVNSIESVTILKDASATAIYGSAGSSGVILITTKGRLFQGNILLGKKYKYSYQEINKTSAKAISIAERFYVPKYQSTIVEEKTDFRTCIYWNSIIQTDKNGKANFEFYNSDDNTSFKILAEGTSYKGDLGKSEAVFSVKELIQTDVKVPLYASQEDVIAVPLWLKNNSDKDLNLTYKVKFYEKKDLIEQTASVGLKPNETKSINIKLIASKIGKDIPLEIALTGDNYKTTIKKTIDVYSKGFPVNIDISGVKSQTTDFVIQDVFPGSITSDFKLFYNPFSSIFSTLEGMVREPYGCFEQVSSSNYPNIMAMQLLKFKNTSPEFKERALKFLESGYKKLKNYESKDGGFEWYGGNPGNEALTAYGLLQFYEMKEFINIDQKLIERTIAWMDSRKDGKGGFKQNPAKYGFSGIKNIVNNAYIVYVLSEIGKIDIEKEYQTALQEALKSKDLYRMELVALSAFNLGKIPEYKSLMSLIKTEIDKKGFNKLEAEQTVINSYGESMNMEIASLYAIALLKEKEITPEVVKALNFIQSSRTSYGFGSTQSTALALKAITEFNKLYINTVAVKNAVMSFNDESIDLSVRDKNSNVALNELKVKEGKNKFDIQIQEDNMVPYSLQIQYNTYTPINSKECKLSLKTNALQNKAKVSETLRVQIEVENKSTKEISNPIARIGIPGGLTPEPWQLKELVEKNNVDFYEIFGNELVFYFRKLNARENRKINIDFKAIVPGNYKGAASSAYLYYEKEHKNWNKGLEIEVLP
ncbi:MG2 domain-containing protein [Flavobacterium sp. KACC 22763]|uniref:MG2 domain-containing protein n=1 Tax=Flavobacterium sp. KACC 22763 TaxID=3025668 RepID=UPI0023653CDD|nr:MG2 domain-containing protein [Flavobacterium sp. KACC 22763]WDF64854.1 TonB-dependent receptor plug domain-containing protein [Flavobacterium sp. KACC 22763]